MCVCVHACMHVYVCINMYKCVHGDGGVCAVCVCACVCVCICVQSFMHVCEESSSWLTQVSQYFKNKNKNDALKYIKENTF